MNLTDAWEGETITIATMHGKEQVIAPILEQTWGLRSIVPSELDTDQFGTFTREVDRPGDQLATARAKALAALALTGGSIALASEGSFGPHPSVPFAAANRELVLLIDQALGLELVGEAISLNTNYRQGRVRSWAEVEKFAETIGFPDHGLVVGWGEPQNLQGVTKGLRDRSALAAAVTEALTRSPDGSLWVETDMRAMHNPTRMQVIAQATESLVAKARSTCPVCHWPGFWVTQRLPGLPCGECGLPTPLIRLHRSICDRCGHQQDDPFPQGETTADPTYCPFCNP
jgi:hypothetical protein